MGIEPATSRVENPCGPQKIHTPFWIDPSCRDFLQPVFMMQPTKNGFRNDPAIFWNTVARRLELCLRQTRNRCSWSKTGMWAGTIVMVHPTSQRLANVGLGERNHEIQTFAPSASDPALADRIRLGRLARSFSIPLAPMFSNYCPTR